VTVSHRLAIVGLALLGADIVGVALLIFDAAAGTAIGVNAAAAALVLLVSSGQVCRGSPAPATMPCTIPIADGIGCSGRRVAGGPIDSCCPFPRRHRGCWYE
jgi:hypothetical protein